MDIFNNLIFNFIIIVVCHFYKIQLWNCTVAFTEIHVYFPESYKCYIVSLCIKCSDGSVPWYKFSKPVGPCIIGLM